MTSGSLQTQLRDLYVDLYLNPISTGLSCLVVALGGGLFSTPLHNSFVFKVGLLKFCTKLL